MKCPVCGDAELIPDVRDIEYVHMGHATLLPQVRGEFCPACNESILGPEESRRTMGLMQAFRQRAQ